MSRRYLFVIDRAPYGDWSGRETLDMAFSAAAFDVPAALLFTGPGVNWLRDGQLPKSIEQKTVSRNLSAATLFGLAALYVDQVAMTGLGFIPTPDLDLTPVTSVRSLENEFTDVVRL